MQHKSKIIIGISFLLVSSLVGLFIFLFREKNNSSNIENKKSKITSRVNSPKTPLREPSKSSFMNCAVLRRAEAIVDPDVIDSLAKDLGLTNKKSEKEILALDKVNTVEELEKYFVYFFSKYLMLFKRNDVNLGAQIIGYLQCCFRCLRREAELTMPYDIPLVFLEAGITCYFDTYPNPNGFEALPQMIVEYVPGAQPIFKNYRVGTAYLMTDMRMFLFDAYNVNQAKVDKILLVLGDYGQWIENLKPSSTPSVSLYKSCLLKLIEILEDKWNALMQSETPAKKLLSEAISMLKSPEQAEEVQKILKDLSLAALYLSENNELEVDKCNHALLVAETLDEAICKCGMMLKRNAPSSLTDDLYIRGLAKLEQIFAIEDVDLFCDTMRRFRVMHPKIRHLIHAYCSLMHMHATFYGAIAQIDYKSAEKIARLIERTNNMENISLTVMFTPPFDLSI